MEEARWEMPRGMWVITQRHVQSHFTAASVLTRELALASPAGCLRSGGGGAHLPGLLSVAAGTALETAPPRPPHSAPGGTAPWSELSWDREAVAMVTLHAGVHECLQHLHVSCGLYLTPFFKKKKKKIPQCKQLYNLLLHLITASKTS